MSTLAIPAKTHLIAQSARQAQRERPSVQSAVTAILVDTVVRDRQGRPVLDLTADDFELYDDGVRQTLGAFTRVARGGGIGIAVGVKDQLPTTVVGAAGKPAPPPAAPEPDPAVTALVFDALSPESLAICQRAALTVLPKSGDTPSRVGVFVTEPTIRSLQVYTDNPALVRNAVQRVSATGTIALEQQREKLDALSDRRKQVDALSQGAATLETSGSGPSSSVAGNIGAVEIERRLLRTERDMLRAFETLDRDHRGLGTANALFAVVQSLAYLPGRKSVVFFSQGLPASPAMQAHLQSVIEAANRINVTLYAIDATGLRTISTAAESRRQLEEAGDERLKQLAQGDDALDRPLMQIVERTEDMMRFDPQGGLARLAQDTGGFLVRDTNDLTGAFRRIDEDTRFHYLLTYSPIDQRFDGRFRTISVKVKRPGLRVFARKGYRALRTASTMPVLTYEAPALAALDALRLPNAFAFTSAAFSFPDPLRPGLSPLVVRVKTETLAFRDDPADRTYAAEVVVVVRVLDASGQVVHKTSQEYQLSGKAEELEAAKRGEILFYREPDLPPGVYTVEAVVFDAVGRRASARVSTLEVPRAAPDRAQVSSLVLVNKIERVTPEAAGAAASAAASAAAGGRGATAAKADLAAAPHPLYVRDLLLYPNAGEPFSRRSDGEMTFYFSLYTGGTPHTALSADVELMSNGRLLTRLPVPLSAPDANARIQQVSRLPLAPLASGTYELHLRVHDGTRMLERSTFFKLIE